MPPQPCDHTTGTTAQPTDVVNRADPTIPTNPLSSFFSVFPGDPGVGGSPAPMLIVMHLGLPPNPLRPPAPPASKGAAAEGPFAPLEVAKQGGFTDLSTPKYTGAQYNQLFNFSKEQMAVAIPDIKGAIIAHLAART